MTEHTAIVFIDGSNLYHNPKASSIRPSSIDILKLSDLVSEHFGCKRVKTIYYNSIPDSRDGKEKLASHLRFLDKLRALPDFKVKTRKLQKNSTREVLNGKVKKIYGLALCETCKGLVEANCKDCIGDFKVKEKGVDTIIAVDMINLSLIEKECDYCILISGDADFIPAMDLIKNGGKVPLSAALVKGYSYELRNKHGWFILDRQLVIDKCSK